VPGQMQQRNGVIDTGVDVGEDSAHAISLAADR
jgi:hypothetical protein